MDIVRTITSHIPVITEDVKSLMYGTVLDICRFMVDVTEILLLHNSLENEIHLTLGRNQYYRCLMGCTWSTTLRKNIAKKNVRTGDLHYIISSTKLDRL